MSDQPSALRDAGLTALNADTLAAEQAEQSEPVTLDALTDAPPEPEGQEQETEEEYDFNAELPPEIQVRVEEPDEEEPEEEDIPLASEDEDDDLYEEDIDVAAERNKRVAAEKKLKHLQAKELGRNRQTWVEKDGKYFPFANVEEIAAQCKSRKEFDRKAKAENDRIKGLPGIQRLLASQDKDSSEELAEQWGKPTEGPGLVPAATDAQEKLNRARKSGNLKDQIHALFDTGKVKI